MPLLGSEEAGLGSVRTAAGGDAGSSPTPPAGTGVTILGKFSALSGDVAIPTTTYMDDAGSVGGGSASPIQYPTSARTITVLRLVAPVGTGANPPTATLMKNGVATAMTCALPAGAAAGAEVSDSAHSVSFVDGDRFDVRLTQAISAEGPTPFSASIEGPAAGSNFPGFGAAPPAVAAASSAGSSGLAAQSDHTHAQSFGGTGLAVGISGAGSATTAARGDHGHATLSVATSALLTALDVTNVVDGTPCYVASRDAIFRVMTSARAVNTWDTLASATAGRLWLRDARISLKNCSVTAWTVNTTTGDDDAVGTGGTPLKTLSELAWRVAQGWLSAAVTATVTGSMVATDLPLFTFRCASAGTFTVSFVPTVIYTSAIGVATAPPAGPDLGDNNFTDPAVPGGSFTAAGALAAAVIGTRTNGTVAYFWFAKDKGATTARISKPSAALANGDTYTVSTLSTAQAIRFEEQRNTACSIQFARIAGGTWPDSSLRFDRCWFTSANVALPGVTYSNCALEGGAIISQTCAARGCVFVTGGMFRGTGAQAVQLTLGNLTSSINTSLTLQGCSLSAVGGFVAISVDQFINDYTGAAAGAITAQYWGIVFWYTGALVGSGNTNFLFWAERMSQIAIVVPVGGFVLAGSSPSATPFRATGSPDFSVANFLNGAGVINRGGNGVYTTQNPVNDAPLVAVTGNAAPGAVAVAITNAPAGSPATPTRYMQIPDGAGGFYTVPSLT